MFSHTSQSTISALGLHASSFRVGRRGKKLATRTTTFAFWKRDESSSSSFESPREESKTDAYARIRKERERRRKEFEAREKGGLSAAFLNVTKALDFQEDIAADRGLLNSAKRMKKGESMNRDQYNAVRRKVGGTKSGFFGESVDVEGKYRDSGWTKATQDTTMSDSAASSMFVVVVVAFIFLTLFYLTQIP